jgi:hypothetical protein
LTDLTETAGGGVCVLLRGEVQAIWQLGALRSSTNWSSGCGLLSGAVMLSLGLLLLLRSGWLI